MFEYAFTWRSAPPAGPAYRYASETAYGYAVLVYVTLVALGAAVGMLVGQKRKEMRRSEALNEPSVVEMVRKAVAETATAKSSETAKPETASTIGTAAAQKPGAPSKAAAGTPSPGAKAVNDSVSFNSSLLASLPKLPTSQKAAAKPSSVAKNNLPPAQRGGADFSTSLGVGTPRGADVVGSLARSPSPNFSEHLPSGRKRIPRVVGGRIVPGIVSSSSSLATQRLPPLRQAIPEDKGPSPRIDFTRDLQSVPEGYETPIYESQPHSPAARSGALQRQAVLRKPSQPRPRAHREQRVLDRPIYDIQEEVQNEFPQSVEQQDSNLPCSPVPDRDSVDGFQRPPVQQRPHRGRRQEYPEQSQVQAAQGQSEPYPVHQQLQHNHVQPIQNGYGGHNVAQNLPQQRHAVAAPQMPARRLSSRPQAYTEQRQPQGEVYVVQEDVSSEYSQPVENGYRNPLRGPISQSMPAVGIQPQAAAPSRTQSSRLQDFAGIQYMTQEEAGVGEQSQKNELLTVAAWGQDEGGNPLRGQASQTAPASPARRQATAPAQPAGGQVSRSQGYADQSQAYALQDQVATEELLPVVNGYDNGPAFQNGQVPDAQRQAVAPPRSSRSSRPAAYNRGTHQRQPHAVGQTFVIQEEVQNEHSQPAENGYGHQLHGPASQSVPVAAAQQQAAAPPQRPPRSQSSSLQGYVVHGQARAYSVQDDAQSEYSQPPQNGYDNPLRGPASQSMPVDVVQRHVVAAPQKQAARQQGFVGQRRQTNSIQDQMHSLVGHDISYQTHRVVPNPTAESDMERAASNSSSYVSQLDEQPYEQQPAHAPVQNLQQPQQLHGKLQAARPQHQAVGLQQQAILQPHIQQQKPVSTPQSDRHQQPEGGQNKLGFPHGMSLSMPPPQQQQQQPAAGLATMPRSSSLELQRPAAREQVYNPGIMASTPDFSRYQQQQVQQQQGGTAHDLMNQYMVAEGIKKAQLRALHSRAATKSKQQAAKKKGFLRSLLS